MNFILLKQGNKYSSEYVNILAYRLRLTTPDIGSIVCYTDNEDGIEDHMGVEVRGLPRLAIWGWWWKPWIVAHHEAGDNIFIDLDMLITGDMSVFLPNPGTDLTLLSNRGIRINSSIISWRRPVVEPWLELKENRDYHTSRPEPHGDQEIFEICRERETIDWSYHPQEYVAWLGRKDRGERDCANFSEHTRTIVCKGPRNPHQHLDNPYVAQYWSKP